MLNFKPLNFSFKNQLPLLFFLSSVIFVGNFWRKATNNFSFDTNPLEIDFANDNLQKIKEDELIIRFTGLSFAYGKRSGNLNSIELEFLKKFNKNYEILESYKSQKSILESGSGFHGFAIKDLSTNEVIVALTGANFPSSKFSSYIEFAKDFPDILNIASNSALNQLPQAIEFYKMVQQKYCNNEKPILIGHSLGGRLSQFLACLDFSAPERTYIYDPPGANNNFFYSIKNFAKENLATNLDLGTLKAKYNNIKCLIITPNCLNSIGRTPINTITLNCNPVTDGIHNIFPADHLDDIFTKKLNEIAPNQLVPLDNDNSEKSNAPLTGSAIALIIGILPLASRYANKKISNFICDASKFIKETKDIYNAYINFEKQR